MSDDLVDDEGGHEEEGVAAFIRMSAALDNLQSHMAAFDQGLNLGLQGLNLSVREAEKAASKAATAALNARQAAEHAEATARANGRSAASWAVLGAVAGLLVAEEEPDTGSGTPAGRKAAWRTATGPPWTKEPPQPGPTPQAGNSPWGWTGWAASASSRAAPAKAGSRRSKTGAGFATPPPPLTGRCWVGTCPEPSHLRRQTSHLIAMRHVTH